MLTYTQFEELTEWIIQGIISADVLPWSTNESHYRNLRGIIIQDIRLAVLGGDYRPVLGPMFGHEEDIIHEARTYGKRGSSNDTQKR